MAQYISKDATVTEIERRISSLHPKGGQGIVVTKILKDHYKDYLSFLNTLETKEVQEEPVSEYLEEEIQKNIHNHFFDLNGIAIAGTSVYATVDDMVYIAKHFANWQKEQMMKDAIDTTIKQGCIELGILIKGLDKGKFSFGDKVKVIIIKSE